MKIVALAVAVMCFVAAALYASGHFPGAHVPHTKHAVALVLIGILSLVWMRMQNDDARPVSS
jgi:hypothetical protein